ncbi:hypothetical protein [Frankia sp. QA3]|uniref:hypothetical protein n=1 Tax=Frankia sp. QA3 TaxID=710111 RepID=UPI0012FCB446|nr:hypothetical protein [Frankia sp. QA3]
MFDFYARGMVDPHSTMTCALASPPARRKIARTHPAPRPRDLHQYQYQYQYHDALDHP